MEFKILEKKPNALLKREEIRVQVLGEKPSTPSRKEILAEAAKTLSLNEDVIIVDKISTIRGKKEAVAKLFVYGKKEEIPKQKAEKMEKRISGASKTPEAQPAPKPESTK